MCDLAGFGFDKDGLISIESKSGGRGETKSLINFKEKYKPDKTIIACKDILDERAGTVTCPLFL